MQEKVPVEMIVRFTENGEIRPLKVIFGDKMYLIDKVYNKVLTTPKGAFGVALEYNCLINGRKKSIFLIDTTTFGMFLNRQKKISLHLFIIL